MQLFNKKLLNQHIARYNFPQGEDLENKQSLIKGWQKALKDSDLERTKETSIQGQFLTKFFETILGYSTHTSGQSQWHLVQEPKTDVDSQEADGALGSFTKDTQKVNAVIELKDARTSLDKKQSGRVGKLTPIEQAFNYLNKFDRCQWAIVSNFHEIRLYSKSRGQGFYEKFDITELDKEEEFKRFYFLLNKENLIDDGQVSVVEELVKNTTAQEENITKQFYTQYKDLRLKLLNHLFDHNKEIDRLILVEKTQKLLDRLIFTLVCEDSSTLLPAHLVQHTFDRATNSFSPSDERVWSEFKGLFHAIDEGNSRVTPPINAYNGGLFKNDEILDNLIIKDDIWNELIALTKYDFESDLNVNILGHIFEQSISDLEELRESVFLALEQGGNLLTEDGNKIEIGTQIKLIEKTGVGKRKKQGIFYTPEYITKFIVENTVGKYLEEHPDKLETIKILDPACGSGAFLNQAHSFLLNEYKVRTEQLQMEKQQRGEAITLWDMNYAANNKEILLNNLFGVDLSPESVEITKLALWLKTANSTEPLQNLDNNVKCGNSLVDKTEIVGKYAFDWSEAFPDIINEGGFDVIIGNPPYGAEITKSLREFYLERYKTSKYKIDTYGLFIELALKLLKKDGLLAFIVPYTWLTINQHSTLRETLLNSGAVLDIVDIREKIFQDADLDTVIFVFKKGGVSDKINVSVLEKGLFKKIHEIDLSEGSLPDYNRAPEAIKIRNRLRLLSKLREFDFEVSQGYIPYDKYRGQDEHTIKNRIWHSPTKKDETYKPELAGSDVQRYHYSVNNNSWVSYGEWLAAPREQKFFISPRILVREITRTGVNASYIEEEAYNTPVAINIIEKNNDKNKIKTLLAAINSKLFYFFHLNNNPKAKAITSIPKILVDDVRNIPVTEDLFNDADLHNLVDQMMASTQQLHSLIGSCSGFIKDNYGISINVFEKGWNYLHESIKLNISEQEQLHDWYIEKLAQYEKLKKEVDFIDAKIDKRIYKAYGLESDEIEVIEKTVTFPQVK